MEDLLSEIRACQVCAARLPFAPRPVVQADVHSRIVIIGQAPGSKVQASGIPWDDASGKQLRDWMGVSIEEFYDPALFAIVPMGFCYPGRGRSGDLPPMARCAPLWHARLLEMMPQVQLVVLIGKYAQDFYFPAKKPVGLTENVRNFADFLPRFFPIVHPSPRNRIWQKRNPWFVTDVVPELRRRVREILEADGGS